jgi:hypothetical protein
VNDRYGGRYVLFITRVEKLRGYFRVILLSDFAIKGFREGDMKLSI